LQLAHYNANTKKFMLIIHQFKNWMFLFAALFISPSLYALTTLHVTKPTDNDPGGFGEVGDLRWALNTMNTNLNSTLDDYAIVFDFPMTIQLNGILPIINNSSNPVNITIGNSGATPTVTIDGNGGAYPGFFIPMGNVTIQNMIFQNLTAKGGDGGSGIAAGGGGGGSDGGTAGLVPQGNTPPLRNMAPMDDITPSGGSGTDGGGSGTGASDISYTVQGGSGGLGGGGGGGGVDQSGQTSASGGDSSGGGGGGGGSGLGGAIFVDSNLNFTIQAMSGIPTSFNTSNTTGTSWNSRNGWSWCLRRPTWLSIRREHFLAHRFFSHFGGE
jgi:hypothetical protein